MKKYLSSWRVQCNWAMGIGEITRRIKQHKRRAAYPTESLPLTHALTPQATTIELYLLFKPWAQDQLSGSYSAVCTIQDDKNVQELESGVSSSQARSCSSDALRDRRHGDQPWFRHRVRDNPGSQVSVHSCPQVSSSELYTPTQHVSELRDS